MLNSKNFITRYQSQALNVEGLKLAKSWWYFFPTLLRMAILLPVLQIAVLCVGCFIVMRHKHSLFIMRFKLGTSYHLLKPVIAIDSWKNLIHTYFATHT